MLLEQLKYNYWSLLKCTGYIRNAGEAVVDQKQVSSFPSIRQTLYHIWDAQVIWLKRVRGESLTTWPSKSFSGTLEEAISALLENSLEWIQLAEAEDFDQNKNIKFSTLDGKSFSSSLGEIIVHVVNHGTYHRGQLITMLRVAGFTEVGSTDFIRFSGEN